METFGTVLRRLRRAGGLSLRAPATRWGPVMDLLARRVAAGYDG